MGIIATTVSVGIMMASGLGIATMFKFLHSFEMDVEKKQKPGNANSSNERVEREQRLHGQIRNGR